MNTFVSHELHVTIFNALSLMLCNQSSTKPESDNAFFTARKSFDKQAGMVFLLRVEYEDHVCSNTEARADQRTDVHLDARWLPSWHRGNELLI
jgi:hypothetical protein